MQWIAMSSEASLVYIVSSWPLRAIYSEILSQKNKRKEKKKCVHLFLVSWTKWNILKLPSLKHYFVYVILYHGWWHLPPCYYHTTQVHVRPPLVCIGYFSIIGRKHHSQRQLGGRLFYLTLVVHHLGKSGQELKVGTWRQALSRSHAGELLTGLLLKACPGCFLILVGTTCSRVAPPRTSIIDQENVPQCAHRPI